MHMDATNIVPQGFTRTVSYKNNLMKKSRITYIVHYRDHPSKLELPESVWTSNR
jgi:hypothetical protein